MIWPTPSREDDSRGGCFGAVFWTVLVAVSMAGVVAATIVAIYAP